MSDRTQDLKNLRAVATACKNYTDNKINNLRWELGTYDLSVESDNTTAYQKTVPSGAIKSKINTLGGMSYKVNQLIANGNFATTDGWAFFSATSTVSISNNEATVTSGGTACSLYRTLGTTISSGHKVLMICQAKSSDITGFIGLNIRGDTNSNSPVGSLSSSYSSFGAILTTDNTNAIEFYKTASSGSITYRNVNFFDLTADFGSGNEPSTVSDCATEYAKRGIYIYSYTPQQSAIRDTAITSTTSKDSNNTTIDIFNIPSEVQALAGYGWGINDTCYNYIDFESKKYIQKVGRIKISDLTNGAVASDSRFEFDLPQIASKGARSIYFKVVGYEALTNNEVYNPNWDMVVYNVGTTKKVIFTNKSYNSNIETFTTNEGNKYLYYELATPVETDISAYLTTNKITVEGNGTLTMENTYGASVPSDVDYLIEEVKA